jgi:hypothetical protein
MSGVRSFDTCSQLSAVIAESNADVMFTWPSGPVASRTCQRICCVIVALTYHQPSSGSLLTVMPVTFIGPGRVTPKPFGGAPPFAIVPE